MQHAGSESGPDSSAEPQPACTSPVELLSTLLLPMRLLLFAANAGKRVHAACMLLALRDELAMRWPCDG